MILQLPDPISAQKWCRSQISAGNSIGYVPTMGALHDGHLSLVRRAVAENDVVCVSIFVNPLQFGDSDDYEHYPRDIKKDTQLLHDVGCHMVFVGTLQQFFPEADKKNIRLLKPGRFADGLEGKSRPGHFSGVSTIVDRLFHYIQPHRAYFGEKDFQQLAIIRRLVRDLNYPIEIIGGAIVREADGLAMSTRNQYLSPEERGQAVVLRKALLRAQEALDGGERNVVKIRGRVERELSASPLARIDYLEVVDPDTLEPLEEVSETLLLAVAVFFASTRLIDNLCWREEG